MIKTIRRIFVILAPLILSFIGLFAFLKYFDPQIQKFVLYQLNQLSSQHLPFEIKADRFQYRLLPLEVGLTDIQIAFKNPTTFGIDHLQSHQIKIHFDMLQLLAAQIGVSKIQIDGLSFNLKLDALIGTSTKKNSKLDLTPLFRELSFVPIERIEIIDVDAQIESKKFNTAFNIDFGKILALKQRDKLNIESELYIKDFSYGKFNDDSLVAISAVLSPKYLDLHKFQIITYGTDVRLELNLTDLPNVLTHPKGNGRIDIKSNLESLSQKVILQNNNSFPRMTGFIDSAFTFQIQDKNFPKTDLNLRAKEIKIQGFEVGDVLAVGTFDQSGFKAQKLEITNEASIVNLTQFILSSQFVDGKRHLSLKTNVDTDFLDLNELLKRLKVGDIPLELFTAGQFHCEGPLAPQFDLHCTGKADGKSFEVRTGNEAHQTIVAFEDFIADGEVKISSERVWYKSKLSIGENVGQTEGLITYAKGFDITYSTDQFNFDHIGNLGGLTVSGKSKLWGRTTGNSHKGVFTINLDGKEIWLENYQLGDVKGQVQYEQGKLYFNNMSSILGRSNYTAQVTADLIEKNIKIQAQTNQLEASDAIKAFAKKIQFPVEIFGHGQVRVNASGPLEFAKLSYDFSAHMNRATIANESLENIDVQINSVNGKVISKNISAQKGKGLITGKLNAEPSGQINLKLDSQTLSLEESENIANLGANISGEYQFNLNVDGHIFNPKIQLQTQINSLIIEEQDLQNSKANLHFSKSEIRGDLDLFKGKLISQFQIPLDDHGRFRWTASARDWNFTVLSALFGGGALLSEYQSSLTGDLDLSSERGSWRAASGKGSVEKLVLRRGNLSLTNPGAMAILLNNGTMTLKDFRLASEDEYVELSTQHSSLESLNFRSHGRLQVKLLQIFFPFLEDLHGVTEFQMQIGGTIEKPQVFGSASVKDGYVKFKGFPHPLERTDGLVQFSQTRVIINKLTGTIGGGQLSADGGISILGLYNMPVNIKLHVQGANFNVPDRVKTSGNAELTISGHWFPFVLSGLYTIQHGSSDKEFGDDIMGGSIKQSSYLPKVILRSAFEPLQLDLQVAIENPIAIKNKIMEGTVSGTFNIKGSPSAPLLSGKLNLDKNSKVLFNDKPFDVSLGQITFNNPKENNPDLNILARSRISDYDINLVAQGTAKNPLIRLTSQPPLPEVDIVSLLALGMTTSSADRGTTSAQNRDQFQQATTQAVASIVQSVTKNISRSSNFDINITSGYNDTKNVAVQKVTVGYKFSDKFSISATQTKADMSSQEYKLKYSFNPSVSTSISVENRDSTQTGSTAEGVRQGQILGIDLEYKREFK